MGKDKVVAVVCMGAIFAPVVIFAVFLWYQSAKAMIGG